MADMNFQGGYFAPKNYLKVNEGGSHDENPNGGVQIGVDQNGAPNMLEEGEPVYNDFVYSDNIQANSEFLEKHNLPKKYAGWLYSEIADDLFNARTEMPLDAIEENGAEVMLTRLAECQEEQKQVAEQRELESMLASLSPEEQDALVQMMAQEAQQPFPEEMAMAQQPMPVEQAPMQMAPEQMASPGQMPIMAAYGGPINTFKKGGKKEGKFWNKIIDVPFMHGTATGFASPSAADLYRSDNTVESTVGDEIMYAIDALSAPLVMGQSALAKEAKAAAKLAEAADAAADVSKAAQKAEAFRSASTTLKNAVDDLPKKAEAFKKAEENLIAGKSLKEEAEAAYKLKSTKKNAKILKDYTKEYEDAKKIYNDSNRALSAAQQAIPDARINKMLSWMEYAPSATWEGIKKAASGAGRLIGKAGSALSVIPKGAAIGGAGILGGIGLSAYEMNQNANAIKRGAPVDYKGGVVTREGSRPNDYAPNQNGEIEVGGPSAAPTIDAIIDTTGLTEREGTIMIPPALRIKANGGPVNRFEKAGPINRTLPTSFVYAEGKHMPQFDMWAPLKNGLDIRPGKPYLAPISIDDDYDATMDLIAQRDADFMAGYNYDYPDINIDAPTVASSQNGQRMLSTLGRDIVPAIEAGIGLYDAFQPADKITAQRANANLISGNMRLIDPRLRQYDINQTVNRVTNQNNALASQILNSGAGASTMAGLLAADYNGAINAGNAVAQDRLLNEQAYNTALSGYNNNESARAQFNLNRDARNQAMLDAAQRTNIQNNLFEQQANNQYESQKWASVGNQVQRALDAMYANATSNFNMNMVNSNPAFENYGISPYGWVNYMAAQAARNREAQKVAEQSGYPMAPNATMYSIQPPVQSYYDEKYMRDFADEFNKYAREAYAKLSPAAQIGFLRSCGGHIKRTKK